MDDELGVLDQFVVLNLAQPRGLWQLPQLRFHASGLSGVFSGDQGLDAKRFLCDEILFEIRNNGQL